MNETTALIIGAGPGLSSSLATALSERRHSLVLAARDTSDLADISSRTGAVLVDVDASKSQDQERLFDVVDKIGLPLEVVIYNAAARARGPITELEPMDVERTLAVCAFGAFLAAQQAAERMISVGRGTMLFTGASASVKGYPASAPFAMGKFALRGLCQSLARELHPQGVHVGHIIVDGGIGGTPQSGRIDPQNGEDAMLDPDQLALAYMNLIDQHRSVWSTEIEVRPWLEKF